MTSLHARRRALVLATAVCGLGITGIGHADSTPVGPLPAGPVTSISTKPGQLVAVALPRASAKSGNVWRLARQYNTRVVRQLSEADVGTSVVIVLKVVGRGSASIVFALTRGDASSTAVKSATYTIRA